MKELMKKEQLKDLVSNKKVLFITTKNFDYIRNSQEVHELEKHAKSVDTMYSTSKKYIIRILSIYFKILFGKMKKYDVVFVGFSPQLILPVLGWKFRKNYVIIDFFISVYDTMAFDRKKFKPSSLPGKFCKWADRNTIKKADHIICDTKAHGRYFCQEFGAKKEDMEVMYLEGDTSIYYPREQVKFAEDEGKFVVLYFGSILPLQGIDTIVEAARLLEKQEDIVIYIIGPMEIINVPGNVKNIKWLCQENLAEYIATADLCLAGHFNKHINKAVRTIPGKAYIYEAMEKAMILGDNEATRELFSEDGKHYFVEMSNPKALAKKIMDVKKLEQWTHP